MQHVINIFRNYFIIIKYLFVQDGGAISIDSSSIFKNSSNLIFISNSALIAGTLLIDTGTLYSNCENSIF